MEERPVGGDAQRSQPSNRWERRPWLSRALRAGVFAGPIAASFAVAFTLGHVLPRATTVTAHFL